MTETFEFARGPVWVSRAAKDLWAPRIERIRAAWRTIERASVGALGWSRLACVQTASAADLPALTLWAATRHLHLRVLRTVAATLGYSDRAVDPAPGATPAFQVMFAHPSLREGTEMGEALGYPTCCVETFTNFWGVDGYDRTRPMFEAAGGGGPVETNIMLRAIGLRAVPHLPCSAACVASIDFGRHLLALGESLGFTEEVGWLREILGWKQSYDCKNGIAIITTPLFRVTTSTDRGTWRVERGGTQPVLTPGGLVPEFATPPLHISKSVSFKRSLEQPRHALNGFRDDAAMDAAHRLVLKHIDVETMNLRGATVLDLGCGDGALLDRVEARFGLKIMGIEADKNRMAKCGPHIRNSRIENMDWQPADLVLMYPGRLGELSDAHRALVIARLRDCRWVLWYTYEPETLAECFAKHRLVYPHDFKQSLRTVLVTRGAQSCLLEETDDRAAHAA